jgi:hypothetical protein
MRLEPTAAPPAFTLGKGPAPTFVGSYRLQGGQLTMIFNRGEFLERRPTDFEGKSEFRFVLRRVGR